MSSGLEVWQEYVNEVRAAAVSREVDYIKQFAEKLSNKGHGQYMCLSPLRTERTPSFIFGGERGGFFDFGTGEGGDLFSFVEKKLNCDFRAAVDEVACFCGLPTWDERHKGSTNGTSHLDAEELLKLWNRETTDRQIFQALTAIIHECHRVLPTQVREHLNRHYGLTDEFIDLEKVGFCQAGLWEARKELFPNLTDEVLLATGFFHKGEKTTPVFSHRIIFPYWKDSMCKYVIGREYHFGFPADTLKIEDWDKAKYKKLPTQDPDKRPYVAACINNDVLWGEDCLRRVYGKTLYITEGVTDAAMLHQLNFQCG